MPLSGGTEIMSLNAASASTDMLPRLNTCTPNISAIALSKLFHREVSSGMMDLLTGIDRPPKSFWNFWLLIALVTNSCKLSYASGYFSAIDLRDWSIKYSRCFTALSCSGVSLLSCLFSYLSITSIVAAWVYSCIMVSSSWYCLVSRIVFVLGSYSAARPSGNELTTSIFVPSLALYMRCATDLRTAFLDVRRIESRNGAPLPFCNWSFTVSLTGVVLRSVFFSSGLPWMSSASSFIALPCSSIVLSSINSKYFSLWSALSASYFGTLRSGLFSL